MPNPVGTNIETYLFLDNPNNAYGVPESNSPRLYSETHHLTPDWDSASSNMGFLNLLDYGARIDSDGSAGNGTDDRAAWVEALADMASTGRPLLVPYGITGISRISSAISGIGVLISNRYVFYGIGGKNAPFGFGGQVEVSFDSGGFEFIYGVSGCVRMHNLYIIGTDAPAVHMNNAATLSLHNTYLRGYGTSAPGLRSTDNFFVYADSDSGFQSSDTSTPSVLIESTSGTGGHESWDYYFSGCRLNVGNVKLDIKVSSTGANLGPFVFTNIVTENFNAHPLLDVVWESGVTQPVLDIRVDACNHADVTGQCPMVTFTNNGGGSNSVQRLLIANSPPAGGGDVVHTAGSNAVSFSSALLLGSGAKIRASANTPTPVYLTLDNTDAMWRSYSNIATAIIHAGRRDSDSVDLANYRLDGLAYGPGSAALDVELVRTATNTLRLNLKNTGSQGTLEVNSPASDKDIDIRLMLAGSIKGDLYIDHVTGEMRLFTSTNLIRMLGATMSVYNVAPVARATTAVATSGFTANTSGIADDSATFGGYKLSQVVKALQLFGILT